VDLHLSGRRAVVVGASKGIGKEVARGLAHEGCSLALVARNIETLTEVAAEIRAETAVEVAVFGADVSVREAGERVVHDAAQALGGIDILINCVAAPVFGPFLSHTDEEWEDAMRIKFHSYMRNIRTAVPYLTEGVDPVIVNVIGKGGRTYLKNHLAGGASNAALMLMTMGLAIELGEAGIRVVGVNPGATRTERLESLFEHLASTSGTDAAQVERDFVAGIPTGSVPLASEVADVVVYLASVRACQVNGTTVAVDGGSSGSV
jgi:3-oxoacyl-[acyl-carrier protein] reductase